MVVDTAQHVITRIQADAADEKDSRHLLTLVDQATARLRTLDLPLRCVLADAGFGSGNNYAGLESRNIEGFVSLFGQYTPIREPFTYDQQEDVYRCSYGAVLKNYGLRMMGGYGNYYYFSKVSECKDCPIKVKCCGNKQRKRLVFTMYRNHYERMQKRLTSARGRRMKKLRSSTVEPVTVRRRGWEFIELLWTATLQRPWTISGPQTDVVGGNGLQFEEVVGEERLAQSRYLGIGFRSR